MEETNEQRLRVIGQNGNDGLHYDELDDNSEKCILKDRDELFKIYKSYYPNHPKKVVRKEFKAVILMRYELMPYFFVMELEALGYDVLNKGEENLF